MPCGGRLDRWNYGWRNAMTQAKRHKMRHDNMNSDYKKGSITLGGAVAMGTGVMIGAGIFALTGQIAQLAGPLFPLAFVGGAIISGFSAYSYTRLSGASAHSPSLESALTIEPAWQPFQFAWRHGALSHRPRQHHDPKWAQPAPRGGCLPGLRLPRSANLAS